MIFQWLGLRYRRYRDNYDNQATAAVASNDLFNGKKRTVRLKHRAVHDLIKRGIIAVIDVRSQENLADPFTKGLKRQLVDDTACKMGLKAL